MRGVAILCLLLTSCGGGGSFDPAPCATGAHLSVFAWGERPGTEVGHTFLESDCSSRVVIQPGLPSSAVRSVAAHELYHVAGFLGHRDLGCYSHGGQWPAFGTPPCIEELREMANRTGTWVLVAPEDMREDVAAAAAMWNSYVQREMFVLEPSP